MRSLRFLLAFCLLPACVVRGDTQHQDTLRARGSHDLQCNANSLRIRNIGGTSYAVDGCGASQTYTCNSDGSTCIPEGSTMPPEPPPPSPSSSHR